jgi:uncharacterized protein YutE (UPF0331/DUF86 family)
LKRNQLVLTRWEQQRALDAIRLVKASLDSLAAYQPDRVYSPKEREPYDALCDRFIRAVEISIRFFRSYERYLFAEISDTLRDLLNRMEKVGVITAVELWLRMRDVRNRIVHDYLPEEIKDLYDSILGEMGDEFRRLETVLVNLQLAD